MKDDQRAAIWEGRYQDTLTTLVESENKMGYEGGSLQVTNDTPNGFDSTRLN